MAATREDEVEDEYGRNKFGRSNRPILFPSKSRDLKTFTRPATSTAVRESKDRIDPSTVTASRSLSADAVEFRKTNSSGATIRSAYGRAIQEEELHDLDARVAANSSKNEIRPERNTSPSPAGRPRYVNRGKDNKENELPRLKETHNTGEGDMTGRSVSGGSDSGSVKSFEEGTTGRRFVRRTPTYAEDKARMRAILNGPPLFVKGDVGTRVAETARTLHKKSSESSLDSEPPLSIPPQWGSKSKTKYRWLERIISPESSQELDFPGTSTGNTNIDWAEAAADIPLPSVEDVPSPQAPTPPRSRPSSAKLTNVSPQKSNIWDAELDFTARSLQISTSPQLKIRSGKLDDIREREIESLSKRAVATSRLEEIRERNSEERSVSPEVPKLISKVAASGSPLIPERVVHHAQNAASDSYTSPEKLGSRSESENREEGTTAAESFPDILGQGQYQHERTILEEEGEHIPGTPITIFRNATKRSNNEKNKETFEPGHRRDDSYDTLRQLSRLMSASPCPATARHEEKPADDPIKSTIEVPLESKRLSTTSTPPKSDVDPEERIAAEKSLFELPDRNSIRAPSPTEEDLLDETPKPASDPLPRATPVVTGAYIDTPAPTGRQPRIVSSSLGSMDLGDAIDEELSKLGIKDLVKGPAGSPRSNKAEQPANETHFSAPLNHRIQQLRTRKRQPILNTANPASVRDDLRKIQEEAQIEDSTLEDFGDIFIADPDDLVANSTTILEPKVDLELDEKGQPLSQQERERRLEMLAYDRMNKNLKTGLLNIRDAKRGIERLEDQVSATPEPKLRSEDHDIFHHKLHGAPTSTESIYFLVIPLPRLWKRDSSRWLGFRFTWLGFFLALFLTWFVAEDVTCEYICHPIFAETNDWSIDDPFWGEALPTLINRVSGGTLSVLSKVALWMLQYFWSFWIGVGSPAGPGAMHTPTVHTGNMEWSEGSIFEDELL